MAGKGSVYEGKTYDEAVAKGLAELKLSRAEALVTTIEEGKGGFLGFGSRPFRVSVMRRPGGAIREPEESERRRGRDDRGGRGGRNERGGRGGRDDRREGRRGDDRGGRGGRDEKVAEKRDDRGERSDRGERGDRGDRGERGGRREGRREERGGRGRDREERRPQPVAAEGGRPERRDERRDEPRGERREGGRDRDRERRDGRRDEAPRPEVREEEVMAAEPAPMPVVAEGARETESEDAGGDDRRRRRRRGRRGGRGRRREGAPGAGEQGMNGAAAIAEPVESLEDDFDDAMESEVEAMPTPVPAPSPEPVRAEPPVEPVMARVAEEPVMASSSDDAPRHESRPPREFRREGEGRRHERRDRRDDRGGRPPHHSDEPRDDRAPQFNEAELAETSRKLTADLLAAMGFEAKVEVAVEGTRADVTAEVAQDDDLLTGRKGEVRQALQHLLNRFLNRGEGSHYHLQLEINDFWKRREQELEALARSLADQAVSERAEIVTEYLNSQERRIVHVTLKEDPRVRTYALGTGMIKRVAVAPADFPERTGDDEA